MESPYYLLIALGNQTLPKREAIKLKQSIVFWKSSVHNLLIQNNVLISGMDRIRFLGRGKMSRRLMDTSLYNYNSDAQPENLPVDLIPC